MRNMYRQARGPAYWASWLNILRQLSEEFSTVVLQIKCGKLHIPLCMNINLLYTVPLADPSGKCWEKKAKCSSSSHKVVWNKPQSIVAGWYLQMPQYLFFWVYSFLGKHPWHLVGYIHWMPATLVFFCSLLLITLEERIKVQDTEKIKQKICLTQVAEWN